jgi:HSP20 family protein
MDLLFNQLSGWRKGPSANRLWRPLTDVWESADNVVILVELAGVKPADVSITLQNSVLTIRGERPHTVVPDGCAYRNMEIATGRFERNIYLPDSVDPEKINARFREGFLEIALTKRSVTPGQARQIPIAEG